MNRTVFVRLLSTCALWGVLPAQQPPSQGETRAQGGGIDAVVTRMRANEAGKTKVTLELATEGQLPGGLQFHTKGTLRVLRSEQGELIAAHSVLECSFADGIQSRMESVKNADGVWTYESNPTFGEVYLHYDKELVADLEWAAEVLQRTDLPGARDARASSPLGSEMVADLAQRYDLQLMPKKDRAGQEGAWYGGDRKPTTGPADDTDQPIADRVEFFLRGPDQALLEVVFLQAGKPIQRIVVDKLVVGGAMPLESFVLDTKGRKPREVKDYPPEWEQIQQILQSAKDKADGKLPPSERKKDKADKPGDGK